MIQEIPNNKCPYCLGPRGYKVVYSVKYNLVFCDVECLCLYDEIQEQAAHYTQKGGEATDTNVIDTPETIGQ